MVRHIDTPIPELPPLTDEEQSDLIAALEDLKKFRENLLAERKGRLFRDSAEDVREMRSEREAGDR